MQANPIRPVRVGDTVNYVMPNDGGIRPMMITRIFGDHESENCAVNGTVFRDGENDACYDGKGDLPVVHKTSIPRRDPTQGGPLLVSTWHFPAMSLIYVGEAPGTAATGEVCCEKPAECGLTDTVETGTT